LGRDHIINITPSEYKYLKSEKEDEIEATFEIPEFVKD
jgi:hypothetical protein